MRWLRRLRGIALPVLAFALAASALAFVPDPDGVSDPQGFGCDLVSGRSCYQLITGDVATDILPTNSCHGVSWTLIILSGVTTAQVQACSASGTCTDLLTTPLDGIDPVTSGWAPPPDRMRANVDWTSGSALVAVACR